MPRADFRTSTLSGLDTPVRKALAPGEGTPGYLLSSFELRSGVEVSLLAMGSLPAELLREFQRLGLSWEEAAKPVAPVVGS